MNVRLAAATLLVVVSGGCASTASVAGLGELATAEQALGLVAVPDAVEYHGAQDQTLASQVDWLDGARADGSLSSFSWTTVPPAGPTGEPAERLVAQGIADGPASEVRLWFGRGRFIADSLGNSSWGHPCLAVLYLLKPLAGGMEAQLAALQVELGTLVALWPEQGGALYSTNLEEVFVLLCRADDGGATVTGLARGVLGQLTAFVDADRWATIKARVQDAVRIQADLAQVKDLIAALSVVPLERDREFADALYDRYRADVEQRFAAAETRLRDPSLGVRCDAAYALQRLAIAAEVLPDRATYEQRVKDDVAEVAAALEAAATEAEGRAAHATAAGWLLALHRLSDLSTPGQVTVSSPGAGSSSLGRARAHLVDLLTSIMPGLRGPRLMSRVESLFSGGESVLSPTPLARLSGLTTGAGAEFASKSRAPIELDIPAAAEVSLEVATAREERRHRYRVTNPDWVAWSQQLAAAKAELQEWTNVAAATADYETTETYYVDVPNGRTVQVLDHIDRNGVAYYRTESQTTREARTRTVVNEGMKRRHEEAAANAQHLGGVVRSLEAQEPARYLFQETTYAVDVQRWTGVARRTVQARAGARTERHEQQRPVAEAYFRTQGFRDCELAEDVVAPRDDWTTREALTSALREELDVQLAAVARGIIDATIAERLQALPDARERAWAEHLLGRGPAEAASAPVKLFEASSGTSGS